jgi:hypothetical protein
MKLSEKSIRKFELKFPGCRSDDFSPDDEWQVNSSFSENHVRDPKH